MKSLISDSRQLRRSFKQIAKPHAAKAVAGADLNLQYVTATTGPKLTNSTWTRKFKLNAANQCAAVQSYRINGTCVHDTREQWALKMNNIFHLIPKSLLIAQC